MRFFDPEDVLRTELTELRNTATAVRMASEYLPDEDPSERTKLRLAVYLAWVRLRVPVVQRNTVVVVAIVLAALSMLAVAALVAAVATAWVDVTSFAVIECAAIGVGTVVNRRRDIWIALHSPRSLLWASTFAIAFLLASTILLLIATTVMAGIAGVLWVRLKAEQRPVTAVGGLFGGILGLRAQKWMFVWIRAVNHRYKYADRERPLDGALYWLFFTTARCYQLAPHWWYPHALQVARRYLDFLAADLRRASVVHRRTTLADWAIRRQARRDGAALAELMERHRVGLARVRTRSEYLRICDSLLSGVQSLAADDLDKLLAHQKAEPFVPRASRLIRRFSPALVLLAAALLVPVLPGVSDQTGEGVRWLLLMTALLSLMPSHELASGTVRTALDRALFSQSKP
ncbi:hypothetical protein [Streptomyces sp. PAN_FS17]|uniref:hypothetical protein n=1 Tax=Streptomyces sp. PAN_FS17 TaxID=1855351 RepID=UPI0008960621|nr:hypothetical protein [Streptomyces sp. PAN_FS17]SEB59005.1 hypothetical protein SAMN05216482_0071 [Streptomyces sp. PAN_FS17]